MLTIRSLVLLIYLGNVCHGSPGVLEVKLLRPGSVLVEFHLDTLYIEQGRFKTVPETGRILTGDMLEIPGIRELLLNIPGDANINVFTGKAEKLDITINSPIINEKAKGIDHEIRPPGIRADYYPSSLATLYPAGKMNAGNASILEIIPVSISKNHIIWYRNLVVNISWNPGNNLSPSLFTSPESIDQKPDIRRQMKDSSPPIHKSDMIQIKVSRDGWYAITAAELMEAGVNVKKIDPASFRLWDRGKEILLSVEGESDHRFDASDVIIFHGEKAPPPPGVNYRNNFYTDQNSYFLTWGEGRGLRYISEDGFPDLPANEVDIPLSYPFTQIIESDDIMVRLGNVRTHSRWDRFDHYFMGPPVNGGTSQEFSFKLFHPKNINTVRYKLKVDLQGITSGVHSLTAYLNGIKVASAVWSGRETFTLSDDSRQNITNSHLKDGLNTLMLALDGNDPSNRYDQVFLNRITITYERLYRAAEDKIVFHRTSTLPIPTQYEINGFSNNDILLFSDHGSRIRNFMVSRDAEASNFRITFQDGADKNRTVYHALIRDSLLSVDTLVVVNAAAPLKDLKGRSYLVISQDSFKTALQPLIDFHRAVWIDIENIYRQYSHGVLSPYAVKDFLKSAYFNWEIPPVNVLIAGADIPSMYIQTVAWGAASSDYWYSLLDGDDLIPEITLGRFPAARVVEMENMVSKTLASFSGRNQSWQNQVLMIAGYEDVFKEQSESMVGQIIKKGIFPGRIHVNLYSDDDPFFGSTDSVISHFSRGLSYVNFLGHGGGAVWGDRSLFTREDVRLLPQSGKTPFVTSMTCFTGDVHREDALGRRMMQLENGGVIGWFGSSGVGWILNDYLLLKPFLDLMLNHAELTIGEMINVAKIKYQTTNLRFPDISKSQAFQFNLTGDPALRLSFPEKGKNLPEFFLRDAGDTLVFTEDRSMVDSLRVQIFDEEQFPLTNLPVHSKDNLYLLSDSLSPGFYDVVASWKESEKLYRKNIPLAVAGPLVQISAVTPKHPTVLDSIQIYAFIRSKRGIDSVQTWINGRYYSDMVPAGDDRYRLPVKIPPRPVSIFRVQCRLVDDSGNSFMSNGYQVDVRDILRLSLKKVEMKNDERIFLSGTVRNTSTGSGSAGICYEVWKDSTWVALGVDTVSFSGPGTMMSRIDVPLPSGLNKYRVIASGTEQYVQPDTLESQIKTGAFWVTPELGTTETLVHHVPVYFNHYELTVEPNVVDGPVILKVSEMRDLSLPLQPDLKGDQKGKGIELNTERKIPVKIKIDVRVRSDDSLRLYQYYPDRDVWLMALNSAELDSIETETDSPGGLGFFRHTDHTKPAISATVNGQKLLNNSFINSHPEIDIKASDENGVDHRVSTFCFGINNEPRKIEVSGINSKNGIVHIRVRPVLSEGDSLFSVTVQDANGNISDTLNLKFMVSHTLELVDYGNFPNPFSDLTRFCYELTESVDEFTLEIFTVDGRRIKKLDIDDSITERELTMSGYHELIWDGRTESGDFLANGVYFYLMKAKKGKTGISSRGKIAKAR